MSWQAGAMIASTSLPAFSPLPSSRIDRVAAAGGPVVPAAKAQPAPGVLPSRTSPRGSILDMSV